VTFIPFPDYRPDANDFGGNHTQVVSGVLPQGDGYGPMPSLQQFTQSLPGACRGAFYARKTDGTIVIFAATSTRLYQLSNTALTWSDVSKGGAAYSTLPSVDNWTFAQFGNIVIACQANTVPQSFDVSSSSAFADLGGSPPQARYIAVVGQFLVLSGLTSNPTRVQWSDLAGITTWTPGTGFANTYDAPDGGVVRGVGGGEFGLILQESAARRMTYVPGAKPAFQLERIGEEVGLLAPYSLCHAGARLFFYSSQGFQMYAGGALTPIGKERVDRTFAADVDTGNFRLMIGSQDPASTRVFFAYKSVAGIAGLFDKALCYDYVLDRWAPVSMSGEYIASMTKPGLTLDGLDSISTNIDTGITFSLDDVSTAVLSTLSAFDSTHVLGLFSGAAQEAILETPEQGQAGQRVFIRGFTPRTDASAALGSVRYRTTAQASLTQSTEAAINALGFCPLRIDTALARGRIRIPAGSSWTYASGLEPNFQPSGKR
jgi:hypothetical protein